MSGEQQHRLALPQGTRIRDFEFHRVLGYGGFGITYLGWNIALDIPVAIKEYLPADLATREQDLSVVPQSSQTAADFQWGLERFLDEVRTLARFQHRNIVRVHHFFEAHSTAYITMDYVEGEDLSAYLTRKGTLSEDELKAILYPLLSALEVIHQADFLHRDIKPGNIVLRDSDGAPVLLDFGSARQAIGAKSRSVTSIVTPGYAPIEQYSSRGRQGPWTDLYALGGVCYRALTGQVPEDATDRVRLDPLVPVSQRCAGRVSGAFLSAIDVALSVDEGDRPQSVGAWREALEVDVVEAEGDELAEVPRRGTAEIQELETADVSDVSKGGRDALPSDTKKKEAVEHKPASAKWVFVIMGGVIFFAILAGFYDVKNERAVLEKQRREQAVLEKQRREQAVLEKQRREQAVLEKQRREQAALEKQRREQAALEKQRREQAALEKQRREQAVLEKQRREQAALEKQRREQAALEKQRQEEQAVLKKAGVYSLHDAASKNAYEAAEVLLKQGAKVNTKADNGWTPLHDAARKNAAMTAEVLLKGGANVHAKDKYGWTPLHRAAEKDASATAEMLLKQGADANARNNYGDTPLHIAARNNASRTVEVLLKQGADIHAKDKYGATPLHVAAEKDAFGTAEVLLKGGADANAKNKYGWTPLHWAARNNASSTAEVLLKGRADANAKTNKGGTPLHVAVGWNASATAEVLRRYGGRK